MSVVAFGLGGGAVTTWGLGGGGGAEEEELLLIDTVMGVCYNILSHGGMLQDDTFDSETWYQLSTEKDSVEVEEDAGRDPLVDSPSPLRKPRGS
jgi:hypothetical protein